MRLPNDRRNMLLFVGGFSGAILMQLFFSDNASSSVLVISLRHHFR